MKLLIASIYFLVSFFASAKDQQPSADDLLKTADRARGAVVSTEGISWDIVVDSIDNDNKNKVSYSVRVKGNDALAEATDPPRNKGETMLFNDRTIWFYKPGSTRKPISISARQKLMGQAANGDIASTNYYRDYDGKLIGGDTIEKVECWKLELKAKTKNVTYDRITYWISKKDKIGVKADFLTVSGEKFKSATFEYKNKMTVKNDSYPFVSQMTIVEALNPKNITTIKYNSPKQESHADSLFNVNNLVR